MSRVFVLTFFALTVATFATASPVKPRGGATNAVAVYAPKPEYPVLPNGRRPEGSGEFLLHIDSMTGRVKFVTVEKSTGSAILDKTSIDCLKRWRFAPGTPKAIVPMTYTAHGIPPDWKIVE